MAGRDLDIIKDDIDETLDIEKSSEKEETGKKAKSTATKKTTKAKNVKETAVDERKKKALQTSIELIEKKYGKGSIMRMSENASMSVEHIPSGSIALDIALGIGGFPKGRIIEIYGPEASGKTTVALHAVAEAQKLGGEAAYIDAEHALDPVYASALGVDVGSLLVSQPDSGEQALEIIEALVRSSAIDIVVLDSVASLVPQSEIDGDMGQSHVGLQARLMSQGMRKLAGIISKTNCVAIFINQLREKVGVTYGNPETTPGGRALKYYSSVRLDVRRKEFLKNGTEMVGSRTCVKIKKNKVAPPFKEAEFDIMYGTGISREGEILDLGEKVGVVKKGGAWYSYKDMRLGQGKDNAKNYLADNPELADEIMNLIMENKEILTSTAKKVKPKVKVNAGLDISAEDDE